MSVQEHLHVANSDPEQLGIFGIKNGADEWTASKPTQQQIQNSKASEELFPEFRTPEFFGFVMGSHQEEYPTASKEKVRFDVLEPYVAFQYRRHANVGLRVVRDAVVFIETPVSSNGK